MQLTRIMKTESSLDFTQRFRKLHKLNEHNNIFSIKLGMSVAVLNFKIVQEKNCKKKIINL